MDHNTDGSAASPAGPGLALLGGALIVIGAFLPWFSFGGDSVSGTEFDDGKVALFLGGGAAVAGMIMLAKRSRGVLLGLGITAIVLAGIQLYASIVDYTDGKDLGLSIGIGLYACLIGAALAVVGGIMSIVARKNVAARAGSPAAPPPPGAYTPPAPPAPAPAPAPIDPAPPVDPPGSSV